MFNFRNIDSFVPGKFERIGELKGKRWYSDPLHKKTGLFKPKRFEFGNKKVFCANHYGEVVAYAIANNGGIKSCPTELAHLSRYYLNIHKERNHATPEEKDGCIIYCLLNEKSVLEPGESVISSFERDCPEAFNSLTIKDIKNSEKYDNIEVILSAIAHRTQAYYSYNLNISAEYIIQKVNENKRRMLETIIFDCLYGNNDRHDENWSMEKKIDGSDISIYPLYDNERILGLYENQDKIEKILSTNSVKEYSENNLFSRMRVPGETKRYSTYKDVLTYLINNYEVETKEILKQLLERNSPEKIDSILKECEGLPACYKKFASQIHQIRYEFAQNLCIKKDAQTKSKFGMDRIYFAYHDIPNQTTANTLPEYPEL